MANNQFRKNNSVTLSTSQSTEFTPGCPVSFGNEIYEGSKSTFGCYFFVNSRYKHQLSSNNTQYP